MSLYSRLLGQWLLPGYNALRGRNYARYRRFLEESQWWSPQRIQEFQWGELEKLVKHAFESVPYYQKKYAEAGFRLQDIQGPSDYAKLPTLRRDEVNQNREELKSTTFTGELRSHATGGSSGTPTRFYITLDSFDWRTAATQRVYAWTGCELGERTLYLWGAPVGKQTWFQRTKMQAFRSLRREFMYSTFAQSEEMWDRMYQEALRIRAPFIVAYVSSFEQFAKYLIAKKRRIPGVRAVIAAAEPVFEPHRELCEQAFGSPLFNTYGSREFMSIGGETQPRQGILLNAENLVVETKLPSGQGPSDILMTDLHNYGMPFLRYEIGDVGLLDSEPSPCGRGLPRLKSVEGRVLDVLRTRSGKIVPGELFPHVMKEVMEVAEFQVEQKTLDHIVISMVLSRPLADSSKALLQAEFGKAFGNDVQIDLQPVDQLARRPSGKRRVTIGLAGPH